MTFTGRVVPPPNEGGLMRGCKRAATTAASAARRTATTRRARRRCGLQEELAITEAKAPADLRNSQGFPPCDAVGATDEAHFNHRGNGEHTIIIAPDPPPPPHVTQSVAITCAQIATIPKNSASEASVASSSTTVRPMSPTPKRPKIQGVPVLGLTLKRLSFHWSRW